MYQPYLRGKQFELIALRELAEPVLFPNKEKVSPIIEPVKDSSTLKTTLRELAAYSVNFTVVVNPQVGTFKATKDILDVVLGSVGDYKDYQIGIVFHRAINHTDLISVLTEYVDRISSLSIIHNYAFDDITQIMSMYEQIFEVKFNVINLSLTGRRYYRNFNSDTLIEFDDYFLSKTKNADYLAIDESNFSEEHIYFEQDGFLGFSDYLTIGEEYSETGFLPFAIAIHLSYADDSGRIKVKHFVSDSNDDNSDIAGKFAQALNKLIEWCDNTGYASIATPEFRRFYQTGHFPGLGTLKKLSVKNHIDLVLRLI